MKGNIGLMKESTSDNAPFPPCRMNCDQCSSHLSMALKMADMPSCAALTHPSYTKHTTPRAI